ncbi:nucleolar protein 10 [Neodiprion lecontei]|uniref:Nucleolar protein 10 n=1 Tax=Neodiprion lecontei TaxID=441921 RepID=A0A6J0BP89_NEOLC|nr:nucleolar protein 10 [Neodiprion lecontei]
MQVSDPNNVKIYNLSAGKSLPEWLSERKRRSLLKKNADIRRRIELIQDFDMPGISTSVKVSRDGQYIFATGIYKPRVKCFDVNNLSLKFERCFDSEVLTFEILSDDYSKLVFLHCDRYIEFHSAQGKYYRLRIPRFGRDMQYHYPSCDLFVVGASNEIYRLNLERGQFLQSLFTEASGINRCTINPIHHSLMIGTQEGRIEAWDPRTRNKVGTLDCAFHCVTENTQLEGFPSITALKFQDALTLGVGTATGQVLLYDIRSNKPLLVKDHMYGLPIRDIEFHNQMGMIYSMDSSVVKIWDKQTGKLYTSIEAQADFNNMCVVPNTGMMFIANEDTKLQTYYIPSLGPAPRWCSFLDNLTEELEESNFDTVYDDYKFITEKELDDFGLAHLKGSNLLRAYMHGYFMDARLYRKARDVAQPFNFDEYQRKQIRKKIEEERTNRVQVSKLPSVNKRLAQKLLDNELDPKAKRKTPSLLKDNRFKPLFEDPNFEVDENTEEFRLLNPVVSQLAKSRRIELNKKLEAQARFDIAREEENALEGKRSSEESSLSDDDSSDDDKGWAKEVQKQHKLIKRETRQREWEEEKARREENQETEAVDRSESKSAKFFKLKEGVEFMGIRTVRQKQNKASLGQRLQAEEVNSVRMLGSLGNREMTFSTKKLKKSGGYSEEKTVKHCAERKRLSRSAGKIGNKLKPKFWNGKRVV